MERRCKNPKPAASEKQRCVIHDVPDDLLRMILLRVDSPLWLLRAACACKRWRRIVDGGDGGRAFLRLARLLHPPVVVGHYHNYYVGHEFVPSSPTPIRLSSLDFFQQGIAGNMPVHWHPTTDRWQVADCHGGLVLLRNAICIMSETHLVVCDPLSRRYRDIHHPPNSNQTPCHLPNLASRRHVPISPRVFLLDGGGDDDNISLSNFRVLYCRAYPDDHGGVSKVYAFSTAGGEGWRLVRQASDYYSLYYRYVGDVIGRVDRSLYLTSPGSPTIRILDNGNAKFELFKIDLPSRVRKSGLGNGDSTFTVVHGASPEPTTTPATAYIVHVFREDLELFRRNPSSNEWVLVHSIPRLSEATRELQGHPEPSQWWALDIVAGGTRFAVLKVSLTCGNRTSWLFSLDVDTMQLQVMPEHMASSYLYRAINSNIYTLPWPQLLNTP